MSKLNKQEMKMVFDGLMRFEEMVDKNMQKQEEKLFKPVKIDYKVKDFLNGLTKDELDEIRRKLDIKGVSKLKKADLIDVLDIEIHKNLELIFERDLQNEEYKLIKKLINNKGFIQFDRKYIDVVKYLRRIGIVFSGILENGEEIIIIPVDFRGLIEELTDSSKNTRNIKLREKWTNIVHGLLCYYGVLKFEDLSNLVEKYSEGNFDSTSFNDILNNEVQKGSKIKYSNNLYYHSEVKDPVAIYNKQEKCKDIEYYHVTKDMIEMANKGSLSKEEIEVYNYLIKKFGMSKEYAEYLLKSCITSIKNDNEFKDIVDNIFQYLVFTDVNEANYFVGKINELYSSTRLWSLKGYTAVQMSKYEQKIINIQKETNKTVNNKIGRNEPCPCGSGKKYKKCCGK
ncbi:YecA family protein [Clostridium ganghwense]|uniref:SEC-C metal-binding domain-containing protein n=1 Tax=Clostridium ganghwense TaxID=312089 RepID=A0ABT4CJT4_9CLOT|nr:SEC-C metal-binding domain-containing protein [Clostridium ganghwense]MCY6369308.1 SEC-C metal-binding domain-containing protein [Clostridium ganghwense]